MNINTDQCINATTPSKVISVALGTQTHDRNYNGGGERHYCNRELQNTA
jgi:hypothetical protein